MHKARALWNFVKTESVFSPFLYSIFFMNLKQGRRRWKVRVQAFFFCRDGKPQANREKKTSKTTQRNVWLWSGSARVSYGNDKREEAAVISIGKSVLKGKVFYTFVNHVYIFKPVVCVCGCTCLCVCVCVCRCVCVGFHLFIISIWHRFCCLQLNCTCVNLNISLIRLFF